MTLACTTLACTTEPDTMPACSGGCPYWACAMGIVDSHGCEGMGVIWTAGGGAEDVGAICGPGAFFCLFLVLMMHMAMQPQQQNGRMQRKMMITMSTAAQCSAAGIEPRLDK